MLGHQTDSYLSPSPSQGGVPVKVWQKRLEYGHYVDPVVSSNDKGGRWFLKGALLRPAFLWSQQQTASRPVSLYSLMPERLRHKILWAQEFEVSLGNMARPHTKKEKGKKKGAEEESLIYKLCFPVWPISAPYTVPLWRMNSSRRRSYRFWVSFGFCGVVVVLGKSYSVAQAGLKLTAILSS